MRINVGNVLMVSVIYMSRPKVMNSIVEQWKKQPMIEDFSEDLQTEDPFGCLSYYSRWTKDVEQCKYDNQLTEIRHQFDPTRMSARIVVKNIRAHKN